MACVAAHTTHTIAPSATFTPKQQQSHHDKLEPAWPNATHTTDHKNQPPHPQIGNTKPANNSSSQYHAEAHAIHYNDWNNHNPNQNQTDLLCPNTKIYPLFMQQQINTDHSILNLTKADHHINCQPDLDKIKEEILQSLEQMTSHPTRLSNQAPIDFDKMIQSLKCSIHKMNINIAPSSLAIPTANAHNTHWNPLTP